MKLKPQSALGMTFGSASSVVDCAADGVALHERADIGCLLLSAAVDSADIIAAASAAAGIQLPSAPGPTETVDRRLAVWLSPRSWLLQYSIGEEAALAARVNAAFPDRRVHAADVSDCFCWLELSGARVEAILKEGGFISLERTGLPEGHAKRTLIAAVTVVVIHSEPTTWLLGVERSRARYLAGFLAASADLGFTALENG